MTLKFLYEPCFEKVSSLGLQKFQNHIHKNRGIKIIIAAAKAWNVTRRISLS